MVGGDAADLERARPVLERLAGAIFHIGAAGQGRGDEARRQHRDLRAQRARRRGAGPRRAPGIDRALAYDVLAASAAGAPFVGYKRAAFVEPETTPVAFSLELAEKDLRLIRELAGGVGHADAQATSISTRSMPRNGRSAATPTSPASPVTCVRRAGRGPIGHEEAAACRRRSHQRRRDRTADEGTIDDRPNADQGRHRPHPGPGSRRAAGADVLIEDDRIVAVGPDLSRRRRAVDRRDRRHRHPGLHRHPPAHLGDVDPDVRAGLRADHLLRVDPRQVRAALSARRRLRRQPVGRARVHQRGHHDARRLVAHHEHAGPRRRGDPGPPGVGHPVGVRLRVRRTRRSWTGGSDRTTRAAS